jgi:hypothetical protein
MSETMIILDPRARPSAAAIEAPRTDAGGSGAAAAIALLHNGNHKFDRVAARLTELVGERGSEVRWFEKGTYGRPAPPAMLAGVREQAGYAVVGLAC